MVAPGLVLREFLFGVWFGLTVPNVVKRNFEPRARPAVQHGQLASRERETGVEDPFTSGFGMPLVYPDTRDHAWGVLLRWTQYRLPVLQPDTAD